MGNFFRDLSLTPLDPQDSKEYKYNIKIGGCRNFFRTGIIPGWSKNGVPQILTIMLWKNRQFFGASKIIFWIFALFLKNNDFLPEGIN